MVENKNCAKCGKKFRWWKGGFDSNSVYSMEFRYNYSLNQKLPNNPYKEKLLCDNCYRETWEKAPMPFELPKPNQQQNAVSDIRNDEKELLRGTLTGFFNRDSIVLTNKRLIIGDKSTNFNEILEVYGKQERLTSKLIIRLKDGTTEECEIVPEKSVSALTFLGGDLGSQESEMRTNYKATTDRWVNLINRCLSSIPPF
jgi:hypothetical protein